jgi:hypothetical protein
MTGVDQKTLLIDGTFTSAATTAMSGLKLQITTQNAVYTTIDVYGIHILDVSKGASHIITTQYGLRIEDQTQGATNYSLFVAGGSSRFNGLIGIGNDSTSAFFTVEGAFLTGATQIAVNINTSLTSASTSLVSGLFIQLHTANVGYTTNEVSGIHINDVDKGASNTITTQYGLRIESQTQGTTNYAIQTLLGLIDFGDDVNISGLLTGQNANFNGDGSGDPYIKTTTSTSGSANWELVHTGAGITDHAALYIVASSGDPYLAFQIGTTYLTMGLDNSIGGDPFVVSFNNGLGVGNVFTADGTTITFVDIANFDAAVTCDTTLGVVGRLDANTGDLITNVGNVPVVIKQTKTYTNFSAAALVNDIELVSAPAGMKISSITIKHSTSFTGGGVATALISVGIASDLDKYQADFDVFQATGNTVFDHTESGFIENMGSATSIRVNLTVTGANIDQLTAGSVDIWIECVRIE